MKITNTQAGPRGVNTVNGTILIEPNQTVDDVKVYAREREHLEASGWFTTEGDYEDNPDAGQAGQPGEDGASDDKLKARIAELEAEAAAKDKTIDALKKQLPETDIDKMTVPELRAQLALKDVKFGDEKKPELVALVKEALKPAA